MLRPSEAKAEEACATPGAESHWYTQLVAGSDLSTSSLEALQRAAVLMYPHGRYTEAASAFADIVATSPETLAKQLGNVGRADLLMLGGDHSTADSTYAGLEASFKASNRHVLLGYVRARRAWIAFTENRASDGEALLQDAAAHSQVQANPYVMGYVHYAKAMGLTKAQKYTEALQVIGQCEAVRAASGDKHGVAVARIGYAKIQQALGNHGRAIAELQTVSDIFTAFNNETCAAAAATHTAATALSITIDTQPLGGYLPACSGGDNGVALRALLQSVFDYAAPTVVDLRPTAHWPG